MSALTGHQRWVLAQLHHGNATLNGRPSEMTASHVDRAIAHCEDAGLIASAGRRGPRRAWALTAAGRALVAPPQHTARDVYVPPPAPARRPGADDWKELPSMAAGRLR